jgi:hypothetical protein
MSLYEFPENWFSESNSFRKWIQEMLLPFNTFSIDFDKIGAKNVKKNGLLVS